NDPIAETVDRLRMQRMMMVQGESQFMFLYEVLREKWVERWKRKANSAETPMTDGGEVTTPDAVDQGNGQRRKNSAAINALEAELRSNAGIGESE
ncbi:hypothetical protein LTS18_014161, partial [Coniosporium uncinatum]